MMQICPSKEQPDLLTIEVGEIWVNWFNPPRQKTDIIEIGRKEDYEATFVYHDELDALIAALKEVKRNVSNAHD